MNVRMLWYANATAIGLAVLVLLVGLVQLGGGSTEPGEGVGGSAGVASGGPGDKAAGSGQGVQSDSALVAMARRYSQRLAAPPAPKPIPKAAAAKPAPPEPKPVVAAKPAPKPPPPKRVEPPEPKKPANPSFAVEGTLVMGVGGGMAYVKLPGKSQGQMFAVGETIDKYKLVRVEDGVITVMREGFDFKVEVPRPKPTAIVDKPETPVPKQPTPRSSRTRPSSTRKP